jgi:hypothetical protein
MMAIRLPCHKADPLPSCSVYSDGTAMGLCLNLNRSTVKSHCHDWASRLHLRPDPVVRDEFVDEQHVHLLDLIDVDSTRKRHCN